MRRACALTGLAVVLLLSISLRRADACTCITPGPACQAYWTTDAVFDGVVTSITPIERRETIGTREYRMPEYVVRFDVRQAWKGVESGPLEILTTESGGMCGFDFKVGTRYLVFSHRRGIDGRLGASICSLTRQYDGSTNDITTFLASLSAPPPPGSRVFGSVTLGPNRFAGTGTADTMALEVRLTGNGRTVATTSTGGRYEFTDVKPARYEINITIPEGYSSRGFPRVVDISDPRACAKEDAWITHTGRIVGRVAAPTGPAGDIQIEMASADAVPDRHGQRPMAQVRSMRDGTFEINEIPPGRYILGVNLRGAPTLSNRYEPALYPGVDREREVITLALGQTADIGTFQIPAPLRVIKATGTISWRDGSPVPGFAVFAQDLGPDGQRSVGSTARSGADGRFTIDLLEGRTYTLTTPEFGPRDHIQLRVPPFKVHEAMPPISVVIPRDRRHPQTR